MDIIPPGVQRFALAVVAVVIGAAWVIRPAGRAVTAHAREITTVLHGAAAAACTTAAAGLLLLAARSVLAYRGQHHLPPPPVPEPVPAREDVRAPARPGEPAYTYRLSQPGTASREAEPAGVHPWPDRENL